MMSSQMKDSGAESTGGTEAGLPPGPRSAQSPSHPVVFFDGVCGLCNRFVDFVLPRDRKRVFRFAPLQGETASGSLSSAETTDLKSVVLLDGAKTYRQTTAIVRVLWQLGGVWTVLGGLLWCIPRPLRDVCYKVVARNRYRWFGQKETCRMPTPQERGRFLP